MPRRKKKASHKRRGAFTTDAQETIEQIGKTVRHLRALLRLTQEKLSYLTGGRVTRQYVNSLEHGAENPTVAQLVQLASGLNLPVAALLLPTPAWARVDAENERWRKVIEADDERVRRRRQLQRRRQRPRKTSAPPDV